MPVMGGWLASSGIEGFWGMFEPRSGYFGGVGTYLGRRSEQTTSY